MKLKISAAALLLCCVPVIAQPPAGASSSAPDVLKPGNYVRRFSIGATLSVLALPVIKEGGFSSVTTTPPYDALYSTAGMNHRIGYGVTGQVRVTGHFAVSIGVILRRIGYSVNTDIIEGTDNPNTIIDERRKTIKNENTSARFYDVPVLVRYYNKDRTKAGPRFFVEGGAAIRHVAKIRTSIDTTINSGTTVFDNTPTRPAQRNTRGFVAGIGVQLIDPIGIRVVPEFRYTRWTGAPFNSFSTNTQRNQIEGMVSITF